MTEFGEGTLARFGAWLAERTRASVAPSEVKLRRPKGAGWSNETLIAEVGGVPSAVVRMQPDGPAMFPTYDLGREVRVLETLGGLDAVPVARVLGADLEGRVFGRPMLVSEFVAGRVPSDDRPTFAEAGWLHDAAESVQRRFHCNLLEAISRLHFLPVGPFADALRTVVPNTVAHNIDALHAVWTWDRGPRWPECVDQAFSVLRNSAPRVEAACFLWGDARPANVIVADDGCTLLALLDWELAELGPPQLDVAWLLEMNRMRTAGAGVAPLPGFLDDDASIAQCETYHGAALTNMGWYRAFGALKMAVLMHRYLRAAVKRGELPADHRVLRDTVASRRVTELLTDAI